MIFNERNSEVSVDTNRARLDLDVVQRVLAGSYWARGIPREVVEKSVENSLCFGLYEGGAQVGFARVITDYATFGYLADVFVLESHRGRGLGKFLIAAVMAHPDLQSLRRWLLVTRDAHPLYAQHGWTPLAAPERLMERTVPDAYGANARK